MQINIRKAKKNDAKRIAELLGTIAELHHKGRPDIYASGAKYSENDVEKKLLNKEELILVAADENDFVLGYVMAKIIDVEQNGIIMAHRKMYIDDVCVDSKFARNGIGKMLMQKAKKEAENELCHICELNVWAFNESAIKFYENCGMTQQRIYMEYILD